MSVSDRVESTSVKTNSSSALLIPIYTAAIFLSAALLFAVQPMFTKMVLPRFGGSPSVWSVAMVFFQGILLLGYAYADILTTPEQSGTLIFTLFWPGENHWLGRNIEVQLVHAEGDGLPVKSGR